LKRKAILIITWIWLSVLAVTGLLAPILSTDKPWVVKHNDKWLFPAFSNAHAEIVLPKESLATAWKLKPFEFSIWPPCTYRPGNTDWMNISVSPLDKQFFMNPYNEIVEIPIKYRHWLGTNHKGEDVLAAVIYGCRHSLAVGLFSMILAGVIGVLLGMIAGYYQNHGIQVSLGSLTGGLTGIVPALFYGFVRPSLILPDDSEKEANAWLMTAFISLLIFCGLLAIFVLFGKWMGKKIPVLNKNISIPADAIITRITEWMNAMPKLFLILILAGLFNKTAIGLVLILGFIQWTGIARIVRAETLSLRQTTWTESAISLGLPGLRIVIRHLLPHILPSFMVVFILGIASSIMAESSLSFLDAGIPDNWISWGTLSGNGKRHLENWWLLAVPGTLLLFTLLGLSVLADHYRRK